MSPAEAFAAGVGVGAFAIILFQAAVVGLVLWLGRAAIRKVLSC